MPIDARAVTFMVYAAEAAVYMRKLGSTLPIGINTRAIYSWQNGNGSSVYRLDISGANAQIEMAMQKIDPPSGTFYIQVLSYER